jgi:hypothetical protein
MSKLAMEMVAEGALELSPHLGSLRVNPTFTVIQEGRETKEVDTAFFLCNVPIEQHDSERLVSFFPKVRREPRARMRLRPVILLCAGKSRNRGTNQRCR